MNINFNLGQRYRYPSRRSVVFGNCGMVATASQLAAGAGMDMLKAGGNAVDAAIATAICLTDQRPNAARAYRQQLQSWGQALAAARIRAFISATAPLKPTHRA